MRRSLAALAASCLLALLTGLPPRARGAEPGAPPFQPVLRLAGDGHFGDLTAMAASQDGALLATASLDKTARLWDLRTGALIAILRPPIGEGRLGELYGVTFTPDGQAVAVAGTTGLFPGGGATIYLFDRRGHMVRRLGGPPLGDGSLYTLRFSADGARLYVATRTRGLLLLDAVTGFLLAQSHACGSLLPDLDVDREGRVVTAGVGDHLCLYDRGLKLLAESRRPVARAPIFHMFPPGGTRPSSVRFSPDGARLAVGYSDGPRVDVRRAADLQLLYRPDPGAVRGGLGVVTWGEGGAALYAAGRALGDEPAPLLRYEDGGGPARALTPLAGTGALGTTAGPPGAPVLAGAAGAPLREIGALVALPGGAVAYGGADGAIGLVAGPVGPALRPPPGPLPFGPPDSLRVDATGDRVRFSLGRRALQFSLSKRQLAPAPAEADLPPPRTEGRYRFQRRPDGSLLLNGRPFATVGPLQPSRFSSWAFAPDGLSSVVGADEGLLVTPPPELLRPGLQVRTPAPVLAVAFSGDGKLIVAALGDGTLRWYRSADGVPVLGLRADPETLRYLAFSPAGYYDASIGGEGLAGWHRNRDADQAADFFPMAHFRRRFFRPDVIARLVVLRDEERALADAGDAAPEGPLRLPPVVTLLSPVSGALLSEARLHVRVSVRPAPGDRLTGLRVLIDGQKAPAERGVVSLAPPPPPAPPGEEALDLMVPVPRRDFTLAVLAESAAGAGEPATARLRWAGAAPGKDAAGADARPRLLVLSVGVSRYLRPELRLGYAAKDAKDLAAALSAQAGRLFSSVEARVLTDEGAGLAAVRAGLSWLGRSAGPRDVAVLFLSGHGVGDERGTRYAFLPQDGDSAAPSTQLDGEELRRALSSLPGRALLFLDSCHAGGVLPSVPVRFVNELSSHESGVVVFVSATARQASRESREWQNGAFTRALLEGLSGQADGRRTGRVTVSMLDLYVSERVRELTQGAQTPAVAKPTLVPDFPLALLR